MHWKNGLEQGLSGLGGAGAVRGGLCGMWAWLKRL